MISVITTYIKQRFKLGMYIPLTLFLIFYGLSHDKTILTDVQFVLKLIPLVFFSLLGFRVFDDLWNRKEDDKNRIHTEKSSLKPLIYLTILSFLVSIIYTRCFFGGRLLKYLFLIVGSVIPYFLSKQFPKLNFIFPLFKYGLISLFLTVISRAITFNDIIIAIVLVIAFIQYELIEDQRLSKYTKNVHWLFWLMVAPFWLLPSNQIITLILIPILIYLLWLFKQPKQMHYLVLLLVLCLKILHYV
jgi:hypothetical protein